jgi:hypothetical protein
LASEFKSIGQREIKDGQLGEWHVRINTEGKMDLRRYNAPTARGDLAGAIPDDGGDVDGPVRPREVIAFKRVVCS